MKEIRSCIVCKKKKNKHEFIRIVSDGNRKPIIDTKFNINARGIYICNDEQCLNKVIKLKDVKKIIKIDIEQQELKNVILKLGEN